MKTEINAVEAGAIINYVRAAYSETIMKTIELMNILGYLKYKDIKKVKKFLDKSLLDLLYKQVQKTNGKINEISMTEGIVKYEIDLYDLEKGLKEFKSSLQYIIEYITLKLKNEELVKRFKSQMNCENIIFLINRIEKIIKENSK